MSKPETPHTPEAWGEASAEYAEHIAPVLMRPFAGAILDRLGIGPESRVLEVGAGSGALTEPLAERAGSVVATDFSPAMVSLLRSRLESGGTANVECRVMDGQDLDLPSDHFDASVSAFALMLFPDRRSGFRELARVTKAGGRVVVSGWTTPDRFELFGLLLEALDRAFPDRPAPSSPPAVFSLADRERFAEEMREAGFLDVEVEGVSRPLTTLDRKGLWTIATSGAPPVRALMETLGPEGEDHLRRTYMAMLGERHGDGPVPLSNEATVGWGTAPAAAV